MMEITMKLDEDVLSALRRSPNEFAREMRLAAAVHWYERGEISQEKAAQVAGLDRTDFLLALAREGEDAFVVDFADLERELQRGEARSRQRLSADFSFPLGTRRTSATTFIGNNRS
jgi:predicted HTH domain antitoxin